MKTNTIKRSILFSVLAALGLVFGINEVRAGSPINKTMFSGLALHGYDAVSYFDGTGPVEGSKAISFEWGGATWRFATEEHKAAFVKNPEKYAPQYGGYCAWAAAQGKKADISPKNWAVVAGKLYLNYDAGIQKKWSASQAEFIKQADAAWPALKDK